jgi:methionyl-tRNA formyltransferase
MRVIFMGSPDFAVPTLEELIASKHDVVAVYTQKPKAANRGMKILKSKVHEVAEAEGISVITPDSLKDKKVQDEFFSLAADVCIVAAYGMLLPKPILEFCKFGCVNLHPSNLPRWRGAAPIQRTIMAGDKKSAICLMKMDEGLDTGDVLVREEFDIPNDWNAGALHDYTASYGAKMIVNLINKLEAGENIIAVKQPEEGVTYANKIAKSDEILDFSNTAEEVNNKIRGLSPYPGAYFEYEGKKYKIFEAGIVYDLKDVAEPGVVLDENLTIKCGDNAIRPITIQKEGKKRINLKDFLKGNKIAEGSKLQA